MKRRTIIQRGLYGSMEKQLPVPMSAELHKSIKDAAHRAGRISMSEWLRRLAERELKRIEVAERKSA